MTFEDIEVQHRNGVAWIWHNRPLRSNAESRRLLSEMEEAMTRAVADPEIGVIVIGGRGKHFSAGHDLKEGGAERSNFTVEQRYEFELRQYYDHALRIWDCPKPTIAMVQGACIAGGFMVANMCDLVVASEDAFFSDPVCNTLSAAAVEVLIHPWVLGLRRAKEFLFTGRPIHAREAYEFGLVNRVVANGDLEATVEELAQTIRKATPFALALTKRSLNRTADIQGFRSALNAHFDTHQLSHTSSEAHRVRERGYSTKPAS
jgi:enoyl-CoA hydratase